MERNRVKRKIDRGNHSTPSANISRGSPMPGAVLTEEEEAEGGTEKKMGEAPWFRSQRKSQVTCCLRAAPSEVLSPRS